MRERFLTAVISSFIIGVLVLQSFATFRTCRYAPRFVPALSDVGLVDYCAPKLWPFLTYPMYNDPHYVGEEIDDYRLYGVSDQAGRVQISPHEINVNFWLFLWEVVPAIEKSDTSKILSYVERYEQGRSMELSRIELVNKPHVLTEKGVEVRELRLVKEMDIDSIGH